MTRSRCSAAIFSSSSLSFADDLGLPTQKDFFTVLALAGESHQANLRLRIGGTTATSDEILQTLATSTNDRAMVPGLDGDTLGDLLLDLVGDGKDGSFWPPRYPSWFPRRVMVLVEFTSSEPLSRSNVGAVRVVLDLVNVGATATKDASNRASGDGELESVVGLLLVFDSVEQLGLGTGNALPATADEHFIRLELFTSLLLTTIASMAWEGDLDTVLVLQPNRVLALLADERGVVLSRDFQDLGGLVSLRRHSLVSNI
ncbi:hypothetical protein FA13DRAFT_701362 [Coprinellus micaceus]|uniref:Uncharacterized protein n=1 Tax=Coprinellus micaceus TaxID=71717 RepID=A0A4Y7S8Z9_COPMI|nr:hypothetical protein FA13DRAFT_701362 [Coprinellus micaceus]